MRIALGLLGFGMVVAAACSSSESATISITLGGEADALTRAPAPTSLVVDILDLDGGATTLATVALPTTSAELGDVSTGNSGSIRITGADGTGTDRVWGATLPLDFSALSGGTVQVFVQRKGEMARMPNTVSDARESPFLGIASSEYLVAAGGNDPAQVTQTSLYDLVGFQTLDSAPILKRAPASFAVADTYVVSVDANGASFVDLSDDTTGDLTAPSGFAFGDVAGGGTVIGPDGTSFIVGATRTTAVSTRILSLDTSGALAFAALNTPRIGAGAAYVAGRGLVVFGGDANAPALEILAAGTTTAVVALFPPQNIMGSAGAALDGDRVLFAWANGTAGSFITFDLAHPDPPPAAVTATLPCSAKHLDVLALDTNRVLVVAEDGASCAFTWDGKVVTEIPLRIPRRGARAIRLPTGAIAVVGGNTTIEQFFP